MALVRGLGSWTVKLRVVLPREVERMRSSVIWKGGAALGLGAAATAAAGPRAVTGRRRLLGRMVVYVCTYVCMYYFYSILLRRGGDLVRGDVMSVVADYVCICGVMDRKGE